MSNLQALRDCVPGTFSYPNVLGAQFISIEAAPVFNYTPSSGITVYFNHPDLQSDPVSFCNVSLTHTHPGKNDTLHTRVWLPLDPGWNDRFQMVGGQGWVAGLDALADAAMYGAVSGGYASATVDAGVQSADLISAKEWALISPGNVDWHALQNWAAIGLNDGALAAKSMIQDLYGRSARYSYWNGCSQGGRQGYTFAQRYPDVFNGIAASAPAINWGKYIMAETFPQQILYELDEYPNPCEYEALTQAAITACDGDDGLIDGVISHPDECHFNPYTLVGSLANCNSFNDNIIISRTAAAAMDAAWNGARTANGSILWPTNGYQANITQYLLKTDCLGNGTCYPTRFSLYTDWIVYFLEKNPEFNVNNMTREEWVQSFRTSVREYASVTDMDSPYLSEFRDAGGKLLTWHGLVSTVPVVDPLSHGSACLFLRKVLINLFQADELIPYGGSRQYYNSVAHLDPNVADFFRLFEAPGVGHCTGGIGGQPSGAFDAMRAWVEEGIVPDSLVGTNVKNQTNLMCPYPQRPVFKGNGTQFSSEDFQCQYLGRTEF
jgi:hypothetical protein